MADILIAHLRAKSKEHGALETLTSQWDFDAKLIPKALQTIGNLFPHYSRHDESHSRQILVNIERLLGESVSRLTATDTWLILEAAYWHDIGMVVPKTELVTELQSEEFQDFLLVLRQSPHHDLYRFASSFDPANLAVCFLGADTPADAVSRFNELMAEWFRRKHPTRAEAMVREPWSSAGISSPRTELIPARLFRVLGRVCQMHGSSFEDLLSANGLPFKEAGMANEDCHPRFVACLLRMGDLLDLDDNRFCPVLQRIAGDDRPAISLAHEDKHQAIRHLRIDRDRIEVTAECRTIPGYLEAFRWFDWLRQETQNQMAHWQEIAPSRELGLLPTLGDLTVTLSGDLQILQKGQRPQFGIDEKSVIGLLQGSNLYDSAFPCIRELLQNAVDATLLGIWAKEPPNSLRDAWLSPATCGPLQTVSPVKIELIECDEPSGEEKARWLLRIIDSGTGISSADLLHMLRIGGSQKNSERQRLIRSMPEWMKPSGAFGIGLQSAFLISDCIRIKTKSIFSNETLELELHSPLGPSDGLVLVKRVPNDVTQPYGSTLDLELRLDRFSDNWTIGGFEQNDDSVASQLVVSMDPVLDDTFPYDAGRIADAVLTFGKNSPIPIACDFSPLGKDRVSLSRTSIDNNPRRFLSNVQGHCLEFSYKALHYRSASHQSRFLYRGQPFRCTAADFPYVAFDINLLSGAAGNWLSASRSRLAPKARDDIDTVVLNALIQAVESDIERYDDAVLERPDDSADLSLFLNVMALNEGTPWTVFAAKTGDDWKDASVIGTPVRECFDKSDWRFGIGAETLREPIEHCDVSTHRRQGDALSALALHAWEKEKGGSVQVLSVDDINEPSDIESWHLADSSDVGRWSRAFQRRTPILRFSIDAQPCYSDSALVEHLIKAIRPLESSRYLMAIRDEQWQGLALREHSQLRASLLITPCSNAPSTMLLPYLFSDGQVQTTPSQLKQLCIRIQPLLATDLTGDEIYHLYEEFIANIDGKLMPASPYGEYWLAARIS